MGRFGKLAGTLMLVVGAGACAGPVKNPAGHPALEFATAATPVPAKYTAVPTCRQIEQRVPGLPRFRFGNEDAPPYIDLFTGCEFQKIPDYPRIGLEVSVWTGGSGRTRARERFAASSDPVDDGAADVGVGDQAK
ncbi:hypothetical protein [Lentzea sp. NPDC059081]|uniref:hypothetical protein n=1 Tax=Lentzea sp. NPDC059081 TaxID=3346719 RepID=UPI0036BAECA8